jgi:RimJ/RimL family protein N-acetyltransferase
MAEAVGNRTNARAMLMKGNTVGLAVMLTEDIPIIARWNQDLEFTARIGTPGEAHTIEMRQEAYQRNAKFRSDGAEFAVVELSSDRLVGFGGLHDVTRALMGTIFVGIGEAAVRRQGFGTEATRLICEYGFFFRNLYSIRLEVHEYNSAARRMYERLGFKYVGRLRGANLLNNRRYDEIIMDLLRSEFELKHAAYFKGLENDGS